MGAGFLEKEVIHVSLSPVGDDFAGLDRFRARLRLRFRPKGTTMEGLPALSVGGPFVWPCGTKKKGGIAPAQFHQRN
jgi:hypothetical protein